jgi:hypothetical protein
MKRQVSLDYMLGEGWLAPWLDGLREGKAVASTCSTCGEAHFPPLRVCPKCRLRSDGWRTLKGGATLLFRTIGTDGDIAMVGFDGAVGAAIASAQALPEGIERVILTPCATDPPSLILIAEPET